jgi:hypothetical protein
LGTGFRYVCKTSSIISLNEEEDILRNLKPDFQKALSDHRPRYHRNQSPRPALMTLSPVFLPPGLNQRGSCNRVACIASWVPIGRKGPGKRSFWASLGSRPGRGNPVRVAGERVFLGGKAVTVFSGTLLVEN